MTIHTTNIENGEPCDTIIRGANGDGKSTLLALVFSCFQPRADRFLKHLINQNHEFHDYFAEQPGFILVEWQEDAAQLSLDGSAQTLITGQAVCINGEKPTKTDRLFFLFNSSPALNIDNIPISDMHSFSAIRRWATLTSDAHRADLLFFHTEVQDAWRERLMARGIDIHLLDQQVEFSVTEGGIDDAFLKFRDEDNFLEKFFRLTLSPDRSSAVYNEVTTALDELRQRPEYKRRLSALEQASTPFSLFDGSARKYSHASAIAKAGIARLHAIGSALVSRYEAAQASQRAADEQLQRARTGLQETDNLDQQNDRLLEDLNEELLQCELGHKRKAVDGAASSLAVAKQSFQSLELSRDKRKLERKSRELADIIADIERNTRELEPAREELRAIGGAFRRAISESIRALTAQQADVEGELLRLRQDRTDTLREIATANEERKTLVNNDAGVRARIEFHNKEYSRLMHAEVLLDGEDAATAQQRWSDAVLSLAGRHRTIEEEAAGLAAGRLQLEEDARVGSREIATFAERVKNIEQQVMECLNRRSAIASDANLHRLFESDVVDPDEDYVFEEVVRALNDARRTSETLRQRVSRTQQIQTTLASSRLAFEDLDVQVLQEAAERAGVPAAPYVQYIAETVPVQEEARDLVLKDPSRFLGLRVSRKEHLDAVSRLKVQLDRPVTVSLGVVSHRGAVKDDAITLGPSDDAAYNYDAAAKRRVRVEAELAELSSQLNREERVSSECERLSIALQQYRSLYSAQRRNSLEKVAEDLRNDLALAREQLSAVDSQRDALTRKESELRMSLTQLNETLSDSRRSKDQLDAFIANHHRDFPELVKAAQQLAEEFAVLDARIEQLENRRVKWEEENLATAAKERQIRADIANLQAEFAEIGFYTDEIKQEFEDTDVARQLYRNKLTLLNTSVDERVGRLQERRERVESEIDESGRKLRAKGLNLEQISLFTRLNDDEYERELEKRSRDVELAQRMFDDCKADSRATERELERFTQHRKYPSSRSDVARSDREALEHEVRAVMQRKSELTERRAQLTRSIDNYREEANAFAMEVEALQRLMTTVRRVVRDSVLQAGAPAFVELPQERAAVEELVNQILDQHDQAIRVLQACKDSASGDLDKLKTALIPLRDFASERQIAEEIASFDLEAACERREQLFGSFNERIGAIRANLEQFDKSVEILVGSLDTLLTEGIRTLASATTTAKVPEEVPYIGGMPVLKMSFRIADVAVGDARNRMIEGYIDALVERKDRPSTASLMIAELLRHLAGGKEYRFGIRILKPKANQTDFYMPIDRVTASGGEGLTTAILLYAVLAQLRAKQILNDRKAKAGVLILDNPFGKANRPELLHAQRATARDFGLQLIYATAINDVNSVGQFKRFWCMRPARKSTVTGRTHVEIESADFQVAQP